MSIDLNNMSRKELQSLSRDIEKAMASLEKREQKAALEAAERAAQEHGYSLAELTADGVVRKGKGKGAKNPAKYRNPENEDQTWSGRGRKPDWIKAAENDGKDISAFEI